MAYEYQEMVSNAKDGTTSTYQVPIFESLDELASDLAELCGSEEAALDLVNAMVRRRVLTSGASPFAVGAARGEGMSKEEKKARNKANRARTKDERAKKDSLLRELLAAVKSGTGLDPAAILAKIAEAGIKA